MGQIIALRFAPNEELIALVDRATKESLSAKDIKQAIQNWRPDYHRA
jgi:transcriptional/translational regulatory protein YebC/TACO1